MAVWASTIKADEWCEREAWLRKSGRQLPPTFSLMDWILFHESHKALKVKELELLAAGAACKDAECKLRESAATALSAIIDKSKSRIESAERAESRNYTIPRAELAASIAAGSRAAAQRVAERKVRLPDDYSPVVDVKFVAEETAEYPRGLTHYIEDVELGARTDLFVAYLLPEQKCYNAFPLDVKPKPKRGDVLQNITGYAVLEGNIELLASKLGLELDQLALAGWHAFYSYSSHEDIVMPVADADRNEVYARGRKIAGWSWRQHPLRPEPEQPKCSRCIYNEVCKSEN